ncbi:MAG: hydroxylamine reductase, partial [Planctomycetota bacterium]
MDMFCYQCEQTAGGTGCTKVGACGKDAETASLQDLLVYVIEGISQYAHRARQLGVIDNGIDLFVTEALFSTVTNVNFDAERFEVLLSKAGEVLQKTKKLYEDACESAG